LGLYFGYPDPACGCGCTSGRSCVLCTGLRDTLTLTTPWGAITVTYDATKIGYAGCGTASLLSVGSPPGPGLTTGDYLMYSYPGYPADPMGVYTPSGGIATGSVPHWALVSCADSWRLTVIFPRMTRNVSSGAGRTGLAKVPFDMPCSSSLCTDTGVAIDTGNYAGREQGSGDCLSGVRSAPASAGGWTGSNWETLNWSGTAIANNAIGNQLGYTGFPDAGLTCSPLLARWSSRTINLGSYNPWFWTNPCVTPLWFQGFFGANTPQNVTGTFTLTP